MAKDSEMAEAQGPQQGGRRPGAMTMAMQAVGTKPQDGPKVLRIGLIQNQKVVEQRVIRKRETVSIGSSEKNHFILADMPAKFDIFELAGKDYVLNFTEEMSGRVSLADNSVKQLDELRKTGAARNAGSHWQVKLSDSSRGRVVVGKSAFFFQFVSPPPVTPPPQLPASAQGGFVAGIDWLFTAFVVFCYMTFFGFVIYLENADWPVQQQMVELPESMTRFLYNEPPPPPEPTEEPEETETPTETTEVAENTRPSQGGETANSDSGGGDPNTNADARARIAEEIAATAESLILTGLGGADSAFSNVLANGTPTGSQEEILNAASGVGVASSASGSTLRTGTGGGNGSGEGQGLGQLAMGGNGGMSVGEGSGPAERTIRGRINLESGGDVGGTGDFDANLVVAQIRARLRAIQSCYEQALRNNPTLAGRVKVRFTIVEQGTVTGASAAENTTGSPAVADCVVGVVRRFRFNPGPDGGSVNFEYPFIFAPQN